MKTLKFRQYLAKEILEGRKNVTWRLFDDKDLRLGDKIVLEEWETGKRFAKAEIIEIKEKRLKDIEDADFEGHEGYESRKKMYETYRIYYGDKVVPETVVKIVKFRLIK